MSNWWDKAPVAEPAPKASGDWWEAAPVADAVPKLGAVVEPAAPRTGRDENGQMLFPSAFVETPPNVVPAIVADATRMAQPFRGFRAPTGEVVPDAPRAPTPVEMPVADALFERAQAGLTDIVAGGVRGLGEFLDPFSYYGVDEDTAATLRAAVPQSLIGQILIQEAEVAGGLAKAKREAASVGDINPQTVDELATMALDDPEGALRYLSGIGAESAPAILAAMATRNPRAAELLMGGTSMAQTFGQQRLEGVAGPEASRQALAAGLIEAAASRVPADIALGGAPLGRRLLLAPAAESASEATAGGAQSATQDIIAGRDVNAEQAVLQTALGAAVGGPLGLGEAALGRGPGPVVAPPVGPPPVVNERPWTPMATPPAPAAESEAEPPAPATPVAETAKDSTGGRAEPNTIEALLADPELAAMLAALPGAAPAPVSEAQATAAPAGEGGSPAPAGADSPAVDLNPDAKNKRLKVGQSSVSYTVDDDGAKVALVRTPKEARGQGGARAAMTEFLKATDAQGIPVTLTVAEQDKATDPAKLQAFYESLGFAVTGQTEDGAARMTRLPGAAPTPVSAPAAPVAEVAPLGEAVAPPAPIQQAPQADPVAAEPMRLGDAVPQEAPRRVPASERPLAAPGLTSYRYAGRYGPIMVGAKDNAEALREAARSTDDAIDPARLEVWDGQKYVPAGPTPAPAQQQPETRAVEPSPPPAPAETAPASTANPDTAVEADPGFVAKPIAPPKAGERWFHGRPTSDRAFKAGQPAFFARDREGANWYAQDTGNVTEHSVSADMPARVRDLQQALQRMGYGTNPELDASLAAAIAANSPYEGTNLADAIYVPEVRAELERAGFDSLLLHDTIENGSTEALVVWDPGKIDAAPESRNTRQTDGQRAEAREALRQVDGTGPRQTDVDTETDALIDETRRGIRNLNALVSPEAAAIREKMGLPSRNVVVVDGPADLDPELRERLNPSPMAEGLFDPVTGQVFVFRIDPRDGKPITPKRAVWVAFHEVAGHLGIRGAAKKLAGNDRGQWLENLMGALDNAQRNDTVRRIAEAIRGESPDYGIALSTEEALAELAAAIRTGDYAEIEGRYKVRVPLAQRRTLAGDIARLVDALRAFLRRFTGDTTFTDAEVYKLLDDAWRYAETAPVGEAGMRGSDGRAIEQRAFHGSPYKFNKFSLQKIGTGEGAQAYGWGIYFASAKDVAKWYRDQNAMSETTVNGKPVAPTDPRFSAVMAIASRGYQAALSDAEGALASGFVNREFAENAVAGIKSLKDAKIQQKKTGTVYRAEIPDDNDLLDYDAPLNDQPPKVRAAIESLLPTLNRTDRGEWAAREPEAQTGGLFYRLLKSSVDIAPGQDPGEVASRTLLDSGVPGLRYLDGLSRTDAAKGSRNYVIWDENAISEPVALESRRARMDGRGQRSIEHNGATFVKRGPDYYLADANGQPQDFNFVREAEAEAERVGGEVRQDAPTDGRRTWSVTLPEGVRLAAEMEFAPESRRADQTETPEFKRWFAGSKVVDADGKPLVVYHGSNGPLERVLSADERMALFDKRTRGLPEPLVAPERKALEATAGSLWFTSDDGVADGYAGQREGSETVTEVYLSIKNPLDLTDMDVPEIQRILSEANGREVTISFEYGRDKGVAQAIVRNNGALIQWAKDRGYDGLIYPDTDVRGRGLHTSYVTFTPGQIKSATGNRGTFDPLNPSILESRRPDVRDLDTEPAPVKVGIIQAELDGIRKKVREIMGPSDRPRNPQGVTERINNVRAVFFDAMMSRAMTLKARYPNSSALRQLLDTVFTEPGSGRPVYTTLAEGIGLRYATFSNRWANALASHGLTDMTRAQNKQLRDTLLGLNTNPSPSIRAAAESLRALMDVQAEDARAAGLDFGEVTDIGYLTRIYDDARILENPQAEAAFLADAATLYREHEFPAEVGPARNMVYEPERLIAFVKAASESGDPRVRSALVRMKEALANYRRTSDLAQVRLLEREVAAIYPDVARSFGERRAAAWLHGIKTPNMADGFAVVQSPGAPMLKERVLSGAADTVMAKWMVTEIPEIMDAYGKAMSRKIEFAKQFGPTGNKVQELLDRMVAEGVSSYDATVAGRMAAQVAGQLKVATPTELSAVADWTHALGYVAMLDKAMISSLAEPITSAIRTGDIRNSFGPLVQAGRALRSLAGSPTRRGVEVERLAKAIGIVTNAGAEAVLMNQLGGDYALSPKPANLLSKFFAATLLTRLTQSQRVYVTGVADSYLQSLAKSVTGQSDSLFDWNEGQARAELSELGIADVDAFANWLLSQNGTPDPRNLFDVNGRPTPYGQDYMIALHRFTNQVIQNPTAAMRPEAASAGPAGRLMYGVMSFSYSFYENIMKGGVRRINTIAKRDGWTKAAQQSAIRILPTFAALAAGQIIVSTLRELVLNPERWEDMEEDERNRKLLELGLSRSFGLGGADPIIQYLTGIKYGRSAAETVIGAAPGLFLGALDRITGLGSDRNSPNTSTSEYRAAQATYSAILQPALNSLLSFTGVGPLSKVMSTAGITVGGDMGRDAFASLFGMPPEKLTQLDEQYTEARKELKALQAEIDGRIALTPPEQWQAQVDALKSEYPGLMDGAVLDVYVDNPQNRRLGRAGMPKTDQNGGPVFKLEGPDGGSVLGDLEGYTRYRTENGRPRRYTTKGINDRISELNTAIDTLREDRDIALSEMEELAGMTEAYAAINVDAVADLSVAATTKQRRAVLDELEAERRKLKREAVDLMEKAR